MVESGGSSGSHAGMPPNHALIRTPELFRAEQQAGGSGVPEWAERDAYKQLC